MIINILLVLLCTWTFVFPYPRRGTTTVVVEFHHNVFQTLAIELLKYNNNNYWNNFLGVGPSIPYWDFQGSTFISSNYIRLTADHQSLKGAVWNTVVW